MVHANVERILIIHSIRTGEVVVNQVRTIGHRIQIGDVQSRCIEHCGRDYVQLAVVADGISEENGATPIRACMAVCGKRVKNSAGVE